MDTGIISAKLCCSLGGQEDTIGFSSTDGVLLNMVTVQSQHECVFEVGLDHFIYLHKVIDKNRKDVDKNILIVYNQIANNKRRKTMDIYDYEVEMADGEKLSLADNKVKVMT